MVTCYLNGVLNQQGETENLVGIYFCIYSLTRRFSLNEIKMTYIIMFNLKIFLKKKSVHFLFSGRNLDQEQEEAIAHQTAHQNEQNAQEQHWVAKSFYFLQNVVIDCLSPTLSSLHGHTALKSIFWETLFWTLFSGRQRRQYITPTAWEFT